MVQSRISEALLTQAQVRQTGGWSRMILLPIGALRGAPMGNRAPACCFLRPAVPVEQAGAIGGVLPDL